MAQHRFKIKFHVHSDGLGRVTENSNNKIFHLFRELPPELRLKVWECLLAPRIIAVSCIDTDEPSDESSSLGISDGLIRPPLIPVLLHINHESRTLALAHYELSFAWKVPLVLSSTDQQPSRGSLSSWPSWSDPHVYFSFPCDTLLLLGELELYDAASVQHSPMSYFLRKEDTARVRSVAVAFRALRYGESGPQQIFGSLFHVVDRFRPSDGRVLVCVTAGDEMTHVLLGGEGGPLVRDGNGSGGGEAGLATTSMDEDDEVSLALEADAGIETATAMVNRTGETGAERAIHVQRDNVIQKIWTSWYRGSMVTSSMADMEFKLIRLADLEDYIS
jgi:hypothetical protein